jgi:hypothetical protein
MLRTRHPIGAALLGLAAGCSDLGTPPPVNPAPVASVTITSSDTVLSPLETAQYGADVSDTTGALVLRAITWEVRDSALATIDAAGLLTAHNTGTTWVLATVDGIRDSLPLRLTRSFSAVSVGLSGTCALGVDSTAYCWGNPSGTFPVLPNGLPNVVDGGYKWIAINAGASAACGVISTGEGYCWGFDGAYHHLGVANGTGFISPSIVLNGYLYREIDLGTEHGCGVTTTGAGICWGKDAHGELGDSSHVAKLATPVHGGFSWLTIKADGYTTCGLIQSGQAYCWGVNADGYLGIDSTNQADVTEPLPLQSGDLYTTIEMSSISQCALKAGGQAYCWGYNSGGELGLGTANATVYRTPQPVSGGHHFFALSAGEDGYCALESADSTAWCWGTGMGLGSLTPLLQPTQVPGGHSFVAIASGTRGSCGLTAGGALWCWGIDPLGDGVVHPGEVTTPVRVRDP